MKLTSSVTDNITEVLLTIVKFTNLRKEILTSNLNETGKSGFYPMDLEVDQFSSLLNMAVREHVENRRLILMDTETIKFGKNGDLMLKPIKDRYAKELYDSNHDEYLEYEIEKMMENNLNQRFAVELLKQKGARP